MDRDTSIRIFKCLSDASRLNIISTLQNGEAYGELLAQRLDLSPSTLSFHMKKLEEAGLVTSRKEQYYTVYALNTSLIGLSLSELLFNDPPEEEDIARRREEEYRKKVLDAFFDGDKLRSIPVQRKKKLIVLQKIAELITPGRVYGEAEISEIIERVHPDYCTLRRDMISEGILSRNGGEYVRIK
ncbi:MAG: metalloregulator ArsR/SmtB family transcription factor [Clostridia bacterium]|nr:metalloregulator ArsR/SmtB family transcription factor [Clostridia bacterium]